MKILHVVPGLNEPWNGISVAASLMATAQRQTGHEVELIETRDFASSGLHTHVTGPLSSYGEIWVHSMWLPMTMRACCKVWRANVPLVRVTHANLDPVRCRHGGWKKRLVAPIERFLFARAAYVVVSGPWEEQWCRAWGLANRFVVFDLKRCFGFSTPTVKPGHPAMLPLHVLYLGRPHPLKGTDFLAQAVDEINAAKPGAIELRIESALFGAAKEAAWAWCDVFCLPTLSENFGLVVAEALEHGKFVVTTDGAPAWANLAPEQGSYLTGYRDAADTTRVTLLKSALDRLLDQRA